MGEQITGADIQSCHHRLSLDFRRQNYIVRTEAFEEAWDTAAPEQRALMLPFFVSPDPDSLRRWVVSIMLGGAVTMDVLKRIAKSKAVPHYSRMTKFELEDALLALGVKI